MEKKDENIGESESEVAQSCPTLCDPVDCGPPGSSVHGILQASVLELENSSTHTMGQSFLKYAFGPVITGHIFFFLLASFWNMVIQMLIPFR